jgi:hypothetical protein
LPTGPRTCPAAFDGAAPPAPFSEFAVAFRDVSGIVALLRGCFELKAPREM